MNRGPCSWVGGGQGGDRCCRKGKSPGREIARRQGAGWRLAGSVNLTSQPGNEVPVCVQDRGPYGGRTFECQTKVSEMHLVGTRDHPRSLAGKNGLKAVLQRGRMWRKFCAGWKDGRNLKQEESVCMCVRAHMCVCVYMYVCGYVCAHVHMCRYVYVFVCLCECVSCACVFVCVCVCLEQ